MQIKNPPVYDISHWKEVADFSAISPRPFLIITKATEAAPNTGYNHTDSKFVRFFDGMRQAGLRRGCYHFFRKTVDAGKQAKHFCDTIRPHINDKDVLVLDIEESGETAEQIIQFCDYTETAFPDNPFLIYSRKSVLDLVTMTQKQKNRLKLIPTWVAGYPTFPDMLPEVPPWYIPDPNRWGAVWLWQYSESGEVEGIHGAVDLNWIDPIFQAILGNPPTPSQKSIIQARFGNTKILYQEK